MEDYLSWLRWIDRVSGMAGKLEKCFREMDAFCEEVIEDHMDPKRPGSMEGDIVDVLLRIKEDRSSSFVISFNHIKVLVTLEYKISWDLGREDHLRHILIYLLIHTHKHLSVILTGTWESNRPVIVTYRVC